MASSGVLSGDLSVGDRVVPGTVLAATAGARAGRGTFVRTLSQEAGASGTEQLRVTGSICASCIGVIHLTDPEPQDADQRKIVSVLPAKTSPSPVTGSTVLARVTRVSPRQASMLILSVDGQALPLSHVRVGTGAYRGLLHPQNVRQTERDRVRIVETVRPGDLVRARILGPGDTRFYTLSTSSPELGVVVARSASVRPGSGICAASGFDDITDSDRELMVPVSWTECVGVVSGHRELRKCARPF
ncbi:hypothetical protein H696_04038 [Fonticula alba]|uniref:Exosome complex component CSL4 C-terminal domain-containing protein n=1 Tax=Fonticula alba TaxID=691883 RepID=A0A058Z5Q9_FONAL|nr:hypothetical protein H696_04038 [Fonticula alba]KCV69619.1 hypothetical protein H696_04038 [Fonticula alba]|eukprot:XP_009496184.1 hypothetical protein H696_04038 [Fonticula alba]